MKLARATATAIVLASIAAACSSNGNGGGTGTQTGTTCASATTCYSGIDAGALHGTVTCLTQLQNGYCSHTCQSDADCCAVVGECSTGVSEICAPLQSAPQTYCFLNCDAASIPASAGTTDPNVYCQRFANPTFTCRSTGGGANNKKFCGP
jgi:hypothetical protein